LLLGSKRSAVFAGIGKVGCTPLCADTVAARGGGLGISGNSFLGLVSHDHGKFKVGRVGERNGSVDILGNLTEHKQGDDEKAAHDESLLWIAV
jgi:hypothetical protein